MKKKTVITTEKREIWVISQPPFETGTPVEELYESKFIAEPVSSFRDHKPDESAPNDDGR